MKSVPEYSFEGNLHPEGEEDTLDIREYLQILFKYKWGIISIAFLAGLAGLYLAYKSVPVYESSATVQIVERNRSPSIGNSLDIDTDRASFYTTQYALLQSWGVIEVAAERLGLLDEAHLAGLSETPQEPGFNWRSLVPEFVMLPEPEMTPEARRIITIEGIQRALKVSPVTGSELVTIGFASTRPEWAARQANAVADAYIDFLRDKYLEDILGNQSWYASRLEQSRQDLQATENALQDFLDRQGLMQTAEGVDALQSQALQLALSRREEARQEKLALERLNREIQAADTFETLQRITALNSRGLVLQLKNNRSEARRNAAQLGKRYGPKHSRMIEAQAMLSSANQAYEDELRAVAEGVATEYQRAAQVEASYTQQLTAAQADVQSLSRNRAELTKLQDDVRTSRALFEQLQSGEKTAGLMERGIQDINAMVIEYARPALYPVRPNNQRTIMMSIMMGLMAGVGLAFLLNMLDRTFKGSGDVESRLQLPVLGQLRVLQVPRNSQLAPMNHFVEKTRSVFSEAINSIRTSVLLSVLDKGETIVVISSSIPGEGKTTLAINLAHSIAHMKKTLLIDADMRRPMVHRAKGIGKSHPGLAALVNGEATPDEVIRTQEDGLDVISAGATPSNPLEILSSRRFKKLMEGWKKEYEVVIVDAAPALGVSDVVVLSQMAGALLFVIHAQSTPYRAAEQGVERLRRCDAPLLGCVLNMVPTRGKGYYGRYGYYGDDYYHEYYREQRRDETA